MVQRRVAERRMHRAQAGVAGGRRGAPFGLEVVEEGDDSVGVEVFEVELGWGDAGGRLDEAEKQPEAVSVRGDGVGLAWR